MTSLIEEKENTLETKCILEHSSIKNDEDHDCCTICTDPLEKTNICTLKCNHKFHLSCIIKLVMIDKSYSDNCPLCRKDVIGKEDIKNDKKIGMIHDLSLTISGEFKSMGTLIHSITHMTTTEIDFFKSMFST